MLSSPGPPVSGAVVLTFLPAAQPGVRNVCPLQGTGRARCGLGRAQGPPACPACGLACAPATRRVHSVMGAPHRHTRKTITGGRSLSAGMKGRHGNQRAHPAPGYLQQLAREPFEGGVAPLRRLSPQAWCASRVPAPSKGCTPRRSVSRGSVAEISLENNCGHPGRQGQGAHGRVTSGPGSPLCSEQSVGGAGTSGSIRQVGELLPQPQRTCRPGFSSTTGQTTPETCGDGPGK